MRLPAPTGQEDVRHLAERFGLRVERYFFEMERCLTDIPALVCPEGISIQGWDADRSDEVHAVVNRAFRDHWGYSDSSDQMWADQIGASAFRPEWSLIAVEKRSGRVVAVAMNCAYEQDWRPGHREGRVDQLGVLQDFRGRGVARALLVASMHRLADDGMDCAALGVDTQNPTGALALYEGLGFLTTANTCVHQACELPADS